MSAIYIVKEKYLSGNPVVIKASGLPAGIGIDFHVLKTDDTLIYSGVFYSFSGTHTFDISSLFASLNEPGAETYKIKFIQKDEADQIFEFAVYAGAVNDLLQRKLYAQNKDIFEVKLHNVQSNFFLSTRGFSRYLFIPENEIELLYYYAKGKDFSVYCEGTPVQRHGFGAIQDETVGSLNLNLIRKTHFNTTGRLVNVFDIKPEGVNVVTITIVITEAKPAKHFIKFRNSFLAFEKIGIDDLVDYTGEFEYTDIQGYDPATNKFITEQQEKKVKSKYKASVSAKTNSQLLWIMDMLLSKEQYFIVNGYEYPALVRATSPVLQSTSGVPAPVQLEIELIDKDTAFSPTNTDTRNDLDIFSDEFNDIFY